MLCALMGVVAVIGDILQAAEESAVVLLAQPLSRRLLLLLQSHTALLSGRLSSTEHTVNLLQSLRENMSRINFQQAKVCVSVGLKICMHYYVLLYVSVLFYVWGTRADVVEDLVSRGDWTVSLMGRDVDGVVVRKENSAWWPNPEQRIWTERWSLCLHTSEVTERIRLLFEGI